MFFFCFGLTIDKCPLLPLGPGWDNVLESRTESSPVPPPAAPLRSTLPAGWLAQFPALLASLKENTRNQCMP